MDEKKVIQINPDAFKIHKKTQRDRKAVRPVINVISPSVLKNKLLKKIKDHKAAVDIWPALVRRIADAIANLLDGSGVEG